MHYVIVCGFFHNDFINSVMRLSEQRVEKRDRCLSGARRFYSLTLIMIVIKALRRITRVDKGGLKRSAYSPFWIFLVVFEGCSEWPVSTAVSK